jgi:hypothetical protein
LAHLSLIAPTLLTEMRIGGAASIRARTFSRVAPATFHARASFAGGTMTRTSVREGREDTGERQRAIESGTVGVGEDHVGFPRTATDEVGDQPHAARQLGRPMASKSDIEQRAAVRRTLADQPMGAGPLRTCGTKRPFVPAFLGELARRRCANANPADCSVAP